MSTFTIVILGFIAGSVFAGVLLLNSRLVRIEKKLEEIKNVLQSK
jgi:hypothetical protein